MATNTTTPFRTVTRQWDKLEPGMLTPEPTTKHTRLQANKTYPAGQLVGPVTATPGVMAEPGAGVTGPYRPLVYPVATDADGLATLGPVVLADDQKLESVEIYIQGSFKVADLTGMASDAIMNATGYLSQGVGRTDPDAIITLG